MRILISDKLSPEGVAALKAHKGLEIIEAAGKPREEIVKLIAEAQGLIVRSETQVDKELLAAAPKLKVVGRAGVGVDNIDIEAATERGVVVMNAPEGNTIATCELAFTQILNSFRPLVSAAASMREGKWDKKNLMGVEAYGKTLGILGLGRIGSQVAKRAQAFGMKVVAYDPYLTPDRAQVLGVTKSTLEAILASADAITLHLPLTAETTNIINAKSLATCKKGVRIINCARGELVDLEALTAALDNGQVAWAGLDVFPTEPLAADHPLRKHAKVSLTPHLGASTHEAQASVGVEIAESVAGLLLDGQVKNAINAPSVSLETLERLRPLLGLAARLASLAQVLGPKATSLVLSTSMTLEKGDMAALSRTVMRGYLKKISGDTLNDVNAPKSLGNLGITFEARQSTGASDYSETLEVTATGEGASLSVRGALLGKARQGRLVSIGGVPAEIALSERPLLVISNKDVPGIVGHVGATLAAAKVNIANMTLGRTGDTALTLLELDSVPSEATLAALKANAAVLSVKVVVL